MKQEKIYDEIVNSDLFKQELKFYQHGNITTYEHSINVVNNCIYIAKKLNLKVNMDSLIKGALLHDYFLYDWHKKEESHRLHGFVHPKYSKNNAERDFGLNKIEENMILSHMFPMGWVIPKYKESIILCLVDKYCATRELLFQKRIIKNIREN